MTPLERQILIRKCIKGPPSAKLLAYELAAWANRDEQCWPSQATLAKSCGLTDRTIRTALRHLRGLGALVITTGPGNRHTYTLTLLAIKGARPEIISGLVGNHFRRSSIEKYAAAEIDRRGECHTCHAICNVILGDDGKHRCLRHHNAHLTA